MNVLYIVTVEVAPESAEEWNRWHSEVHVPEVLHEPGFSGCTKWRDEADAADGWKRFHTHFKVTDRAAFERYTTSDAAKRLRADSLERFGSVTRYQRAVLGVVQRWD